MNDRIDRGLGIEADVDTENGAVVVSLYRPQDTNKEEPIEIRASASELLYALDRQAYIDALDKLRGLDLKLAKEVAPDDDAEPISDVAQEAEVSVISHEERVRVERVAAYEGTYSELVADLFVYLRDEVQFESLEEGQIPELAATILKRMESLVVVDWQVRDSLLAKVRLAIRRGGKLFSEELGDDAVQGILEWLIQHIDSGVE